MSEYLSNKIKLLSFFLIILVLFIHSGFHQNEIAGMYWNNLIQEFISGKLGRLAVPLFFLISGSLFFLNTEFGMMSIKSKMVSRVKTILLPYLYGCSFFVLLILLIQLIPSTSAYTNGDGYKFEDKSILIILRNIFWMADGSNSPLAFHLWFLRDLLMIVILSPILYYLFKSFKWWTLILLFVMSFFTIINSKSLSTSLLWFSFGSLFSITKTSIDFGRTIWGVVILFFYIIISLYEQIKGGFYFVYIQNILVVIGVVGVWLSYDYFIKRGFSLKENKLLSFYCSFTFFIYLVHEPSLNVVRKMIIIILEKNSIGYLTSYLLSPFIFVFFSVRVGILVKKMFPKIYSNLVGGRI